MKKKTKMNSGFTLIEMLVVIAIIALLAAILVPTVTSALENANRTRVLSNGRGIHQSILAADLETVLFADEIYWPVEDANHGTSTAYFVWLMDEDRTVLSEDFGVFTASNVTQAVDLNTFENNPDRHNAWSVFEDVTKESPSRHPFMVTRNLSLGSLSGNEEGRIPEGTVGSNYPNPYGDRAIVVIRIGGGGEAITGRNLTYRNLNPAEADFNILEPQ